MKKTIPILLFIGLFLLIPKLAYAGLSEDCFPAVECDAGEDYYADDCKTHIEVIGDCGVPPADQYYGFSCDNGCYLRSNSAPNPCPGGVMVGATCMTTLDVVKDSTDNDIYKIFDNPDLAQLVYSDPCADGQVLSWDAGNSEWACGPKNFTYFQDAGGGDIYYNGGNVGIGNTTPIKDLTVGSTISPGEMRLQGNASNKYLDMSADGITLSSGGNDYFTADITGDVHAALDITAGFSVSSLILNATNQVVSPVYCIVGDCISNWDQAGSPAVWSLNGSDVYYTGGFVGIGTTNPSVSLHVMGDIKAEGGTVFADNFSSNSPLELQADGVTRLFIDDITGNVGIGTISPSNELSISDGGGLSGTPIIDLNGRAIFGYDGVRAAALIGGISGKNIVFDTDGTNERMRITSGGDVGIGVINPSSKLHINAASGDPFRVQVAGGTKLLVSNNGDLYAYGDVGIGDGTPDAKLDVAGDAIFDGSVGIGTSSPNSKLQVYGLAGVTAFRVQVAGSSKFTVGSNGGVSIGAYQDTPPVNGLYVSGDVGIGTASPQDKLHVIGDIRLPSGNELFFTDNGQIRSMDDNHKILFRRTENKMEFREFGDLIFSPGAIAGTETAKVVMQAGGNVGIGDSTPSARLEIDSTDGIDPLDVKYQMLSKLRVHDNGGVSIGTSTTPPNNGLYVYNDLWVNGTTASNYALYVVGTAYSTTGWSGSDERWKKNIEPLSNSLDKVLKLQGVNYEWRTDEFPDRGFEEGAYIGLIAQDVEKVMPKLIRTDEDGYKVMAYDRLSVVLVEAMKELKAENDKLKTRVEVLEAK